MKNIYVQNEAKKNFKDWSKQGLEFLLNIDDVNKNIKLKARKAIDKLQTTQTLPF